ncbi:MAG TPA: hypothetical protein VHC19_23380 [Pirellulales bacterium]|jgi:hypothetical protein|nr:hypothetical protein [Pirellulales bacterium]
MNLLGKIFVVLILVMSLVFLGMSLMVYATHKNWIATINRTQQEVKPGQPLGLKHQLAEAKAKVADLEAQLAKLKTEVDSEEAARRVQLAKLETEKAELKKEYDDLLQREATIKEETRVAQETTKQSQEMLSAKLEEIGTLRDQMAKAYSDRDTQFDNSVALEDKLHQATNELTRAQANAQMLTTLTAQYRKAAERKGVDLEASVDNIPPKLDGVVLASRSDGMVEMSLGGDDGLRPGHRVFLYRNHAGTSKFLGVAEVVKTTPDKSVGKLVPEFKKGPIVREDRVATRLN